MYCDQCKHYDGCDLNPKYNDLIAADNPGMEKRQRAVDPVNGLPCLSFHSREITPDEARAIAEQLDAGKKIMAIKFFRDATGSPLRDAKYFVDNLVEAAEAMMPERWIQESGGVTYIMHRDSDRCDEVIIVDMLNCGQMERELFNYLPDKKREKIYNRMVELLEERLKKEFDWAVLREVKEELVSPEIPPVNVDFVLRNWIRARIANGETMADIQLTIAELANAES